MITTYTVKKNRKGDYELLDQDGNVQMWNFLLHRVLFAAYEDYYSHFNGEVTFDADGVAILTLEQSESRYANRKDRDY